MSAPDPQRTRPALGTAVHAAAMLSAAAVVLAAALTLSTPAGHRALDLGPTPVVGLLAAGVGALIVGRAPRNLVAWLLIASGISSAAYSLTTAATALGLLADPQAPWLPWTAWVSTSAWVPGAMLGLVLLPQLFPFGTLLPGRFWRAWWWFSLSLAAAVFLSLAMTPASPLFPSLPNPWLRRVENAGLSSAVEAAAGPWGMLLTVLFAALSAGSVVNLVLRFRRAGAVERRQTFLVFTAWLVLIVASAVAIPWLGAMAAALYLGALLFSVARFQLYEIDQLVSRSAVGLVAVVVLGTAYALTASGVGAILQNLGGSWLAGSWWPGFTATAVVLVLLDPVRRLALRWVNRAFARGRPDAGELAAELSAIASHAPTPRAALEDAQTLLRNTLHMPALELVAHGETAALPAAAALPGAAMLRESALSSLPVHSLPVHWNGVPAGAVVLAPRKGGVRVHPADLRLLAALEPALALMVHDLLLTQDLEASRRSVLGAREEERRRIRRDLHDGLGPLLSGTAMTLQAAGAASVDPPAVQELLAQARADLGQAVADIRVLVDGLRPPILDDLGLVAAVQAILPESALAVTVTTQGNCKNLPAAVEVAALRIVAEALANAARHAKASTAQVELRRTDAKLHLSVADDGRWAPPSSIRKGVGLESIRQRAQELGGRAKIEFGADTGTRVRAWLPLGEGL